MPEDEEPEEQTEPSYLDPGWYRSLHSYPIAVDIWPAAYVESINQLLGVAGSPLPESEDSEEERIEAAGRTWSERKKRLDEWLEETAHIVDPDSAGWEVHAGKSPIYDRPEDNQPEDEPSTHRLQARHTEYRNEYLAGWQRYLRLHRRLGLWVMSRTTR